MMRVLINSWRDLCHPNAGGSEVVVDQLANGLRHRGHDVTVRAGGPTDDHEHYTAVAGGGTYTQYVPRLSDVRRMRSMDIVVDVNNGMGFYSPLFTDVPTVGLVHHVHTSQWPLYFPAPIAALGSWQERALMPRAYRSSVIVATSPSTHASLKDLGLHPDRIRQIPLTVDLHAPDDVAKSPEPLVVACGRLTAHKRIDVLLQLWERVRPTTGGRLVIIGDGPERARLEAMAGPGVEFTGHVSNEEKARLLASAWLLTHTAPWEGWGLVITEAGVCGTPSVGFDVRGVRDAIRGGRSGLLAADGDEFVASWLSLVGDPELRARLGEGARRYANSLAAADPADVFEAVLLEAIELHGNRRSRPVSFPDGLALDVEVTPDAVWSDPAGTRRSIVVPAYNEADRLPALLADLLPRLDPIEDEVVIADDGSTDNTSAVAARLLRDRAHHIVRSDNNRGKGAALRAGVAAARGRTIVFVDADNATDLEALEPLIAELDQHDVAIGSRRAATSTVADGSAHRRWMARGFNLMVRRLTGLSLADSQCGFKAFRGPAARLLFHLSEIDGFAQDVEVLDLATSLGMTVAEVPVQWRAVPGSKVDPIRHSLEMARDLLGHRVRPANAAVITGLTCQTPDITPTVLAKELRRVVRATDPVLVDSDAVHVLLAGVEHANAAAVAERIGATVGCADLRRWSVDARSVLRLSEAGSNLKFSDLGELAG